jgi:hypothetical protein
MDSPKEFLMKTRSMAPGFLFLAWLLTMTPSAFAQVDRVIVEAEGMKDACVPGLQAALESMPSVYKYAISVEKQMFTVIYNAGEKFDTRRLYWAADKGEAGVKAIHMFARGTIHEEDGRQIFVSGENRFLVVSAQKLPPDVNIGIVGVVDDSKELMQLKPDDFQVLKQN